VLLHHSDFLVVRIPHCFCRVQLVLPLVVDELFDESIFGVHGIRHGVLYLTRKFRP
jgi:hypothetical protein